MHEPSRIHAYPSMLLRKEVSVFFSDIVGFTSMCEHMDPQKVADMLQRIFLKFDLIAHKYAIEKVDVIGDAYIACCNFIEHHGKCFGLTEAEVTVYSLVPFVCFV